MIYAKLWIIKGRCAFHVRADTLDEIKRYADTLQGNYILERLEWHKVNLDCKSSTVELLGEIKEDNNESH